MPFWGARARIACAATAALSLGKTSSPFSGSLKTPWETLCQANKTIAPARVARASRRGRILTDLRAEGGFETDRGQIVRRSWTERKGATALREREGRTEKGRTKNTERRRTGREERAEKNGPNTAQGIRKSGARFPSGVLGPVFSVRCSRSGVLGPVFSVRCFRSGVFGSIKPFPPSFHLSLRTLG